MRESKRKSESSRIRLLTSRNFKWYAALLVVVTAFTWATGQLDNRYEPLTLPGYGDVFPQESQNWELVGNSDLLKTEPEKFQISPGTENHTRAEFLIDLPEYMSTDYNLVRVRSVINTLQRPSTSSLKTDAGLLIRLIDSNDEVTSRGWVSQLSGEFDTHRDEQLVALDSKTKAVRLVFTNRASDGSFELEQVKLDIVKTSAIYELAIFPALLVLWSVLVLISGYYLAKKLGTGRTLVLGGALLVLIGGVLLPTGLRELTITPMFNQLQSIGLVGDNMALIHYYKIGHFLTFFVVALVLFQSTRRLRLSRTDICVVMLLLAIATEGAQLHLFFRTTQLLDIVIDMGGVLMALVLHHILLKTMYKDREKRKRQTKRTRRTSRKSHASQMQQATSQEPRMSHTPRAERLS